MNKVEDRIVNLNPPLFFARPDSRKDSFLCFWYALHINYSVSELATNVSYWLQKVLEM